MTDMGPIARSDKGDGFRLGDELSPGVASGVDYGVVGFEDAG